MGFCCEFQKILTFLTYTTFTANDSRRRVKKRVLEAACLRKQALAGTY